jgi:hypothetical protein|tara:strand:+ start:579 stop:905 length:327 start_codon:yes stop_codon:yes gene_type:complete
MISREISSFVATDADNNATSTATRAAPSEGLSHFITSVSGGYSGAAAGKTLILKEGSTEVGRWYVHDSFNLSFSSPIKLSPGTVANLELEASGSGGVTGAVTMTGYTV